jgi:uncharacterized protein (DUF433 family)
MASFKFRDAMPSERRSPHRRGRIGVHRRAEPVFGAPTAKIIFAFGRGGRYFQTMQAVAYRYLVNLPGVCNGRTIVEGTRIGIHDVVGLIVNGATIENVLRSFPPLTKAQVYECLAYYEDHRTEIDALIAEQMSETLA